METPNGEYLTFEEDSDDAVDCAKIEQQHQKRQKRRSAKLNELKFLPWETIQRTL